MDCRPVDNPRSRRPAAAARRPAGERGRLDPGRRRPVHAALRPTRHVHDRRPGVRRAVGRSCDATGHAAAGNGARRSRAGVGGRQSEGPRCLRSRRAGGVGRVGRRASWGCGRRVRRGWHAELCDRRRQAEHGPRGRRCLPARTRVHHRPRGHRQAGLERLARRGRAGLARRTRARDPHLRRESPSAADYPGLARSGKGQGVVPQCNMGLRRRA